MATNKPEIVLSAVDKTKAAFASVKSGLSDVENSASRLANIKLGAAIGAAVSGAGIALFVRNTVDGLDALNDLKDATGASIENISALEDVAARTGTSFDTMSSSLVKFNKVLLDSKAGSETANTIKKLGLSVEELKKLDPAEALRQTAVALNGFAEDGDRARIVASLFGKSVAEVAPFLKDLAEQGSLVAKVTTEQAQAAEDFNKALDNLSKNATDTGRALLSDLVPAMASVIKTFNDQGLKAAMDDFGERLFGWTTNQQRKEIKRVESEISDLRKEFEAWEGVPRQQQRVSEAIDASAKKLAALSRAYLKLNDGSAGGGRGEINPALVKPSIGGAPGATTKAKDPSLTYDQIAKLQLEAEEQFQKDSAEAWEFYNKQIVADAKETAEAEKLMWKQIFEEIDAEQDRSIEEGKAYLDSLSTELSEFGKEAQRNIQDALGDTIAKTFKGEFDSIGEMWKNLLIEMTAQALAAQLNTALFGNGTAGSTGALTSVFAGLFSGQGFAAGGNPPVGQFSMVGENGPELFMPKSAGTIIPNDQLGGQTFTFNNTYNIGQGVSRGEVQAAVQAGQAQTKAEIQRSMRQGSYA